MLIILEKERANRAWKRVEEVGKKPEKVQGRYRSQVRGGPAMIQRNGLGQYLAFLGSSGFKGGQLSPEDKPKDHADGLLYQHLGAWMLKVVGVQPNEPAAEAVKPGAGRESDPLTWLMHDGTTLEQMMWATREALAFLQWARRFAESQLKQPDPQDE